MAGLSFNALQDVGHDQNIGGWRLASASVVGTSHSRTGTPCQDAHRCAVVTPPGAPDLLVVIVCDGAGSAQHSDVGSQLVANSFIDYVSGCLSQRPEVFFEKGFVLNWLRIVIDRLSQAAEKAETELRDFACTCLGAIIGKGQSAFFQVGDGAMVIDDTVDSYAWIFWPSKGEFANETTFITSPDVDQHLEFEYIDVEPQRLAVFSDGLERLILNMNETSVHANLLNKLFGAIREDSTDEDLSSSLALLLDSPQINERTDDDKTLVLAMRLRADDA